MAKVGIIGVGTVGTSVAKILECNQDIISARAGDEIEVKLGVVKDLATADPSITLPLTTQIDDVLNDPEIDIVVELMGGVELPFEVARKALRNGKSFVTANKAMLAYHRYELQEAAGDLPFGFEASVAGGIPIIKSLKDGLSANHILSIRGILNGTCNYISTKMMAEGCEFLPVLDEAQKLGYAEADPTLDVGGWDASHKLVIMASIAYGINAKPEDIIVEGIDKLTPDEFEFAKDFNYNIKLLALAKRIGNEVELRVHPAFVPQDQMISKVDGVMNGISVIGDQVGETMYYGPGAGGDATASAVISDIIQIVRKGKPSPMLGFKKPLEEGLKLRAKQDVESKYYFRLRVADKPGVLATLAGVCQDQGISIEKVLQKPVDEGCANLFLSSHVSKESAIQEAVSKMKLLDAVLQEPFVLRIEEDE